MIIFFSFFFFFKDRHIDKTIGNFTRNLSYRNKKIVPDIGEFLIQIALSKDYQLNDIKEYVYEEYFARQIYWLQRADIIDNLLDLQTKHLPQIFQAVKISNHLLVFNLEMAQTFIFKGVKELVELNFSLEKKTSFFFSSQTFRSSIWLSSGCCC